MDISKLYKKITDGVIIPSGSANITAGLESSDEVVKNANINKLKGLADSIETVLKTTVVSGNESTITQMQIDSAVSAAGAALGNFDGLFARMESRTNSNSDNCVALNPTDTMSIGGNNLSVNELRAGIEAFNAKDIKVASHRTILYNTFAIKQDPVAELFFPVVVTDPKYKNTSVSLKVVSLMDSYKRDTSGARANFKKLPIVKELDNTALFTTEAARLYPVKRDDSEDKLLTNVVISIDNGDATNVTTYPLRTGMDIDVLGITQSAESLTTGMTDETDGLDSNISISTLYFEVAGKNSNGEDVVETLSRDIKGIPARFVPSMDGNSKDMQLNYVTSSISWKAGNINNAEGIPTAITDLLDIPTGYTVRVGVELAGRANVETGNVAVHGIGVKLIAILDTANVRINETSDVFIKAKAILNNAKVSGYAADLRASNTNMRFKSKKFTTDTYKFFYTLAVRTMFREQYEINSSGNDGDTGGLLGQIQATQITMSKFGLLELDNTMSTLDVIADSEDIVGPSNLLCKTTGIRAVLDMTTIVDGQESAKRESDVTSALQLYIRNAALKMNKESGYGTTYRTLNPGVKPTIIIGTDTTIGGYIEDFTDGIFNYVVKTSEDSIIAGKLYIGFGSSVGKAKKEADIFNFGACFWSPETTLTAQISDGGSTRHEAIVMPTFRHQRFIDVLTVVEVTGMEEVTKRIN